MILWIFYEGIFYVTPERQVGAEAWRARCLSIAVGVFLISVNLLVVLCRKIRRSFIEQCRISLSQRRVKRGCEILMLVIGMIAFLAYGVSRVVLVVPLVQDVYYGPTYDRVVQVKVSHEVERVKLRNGSERVPVVMAEVETASGDKTRVRLRMDEWKRYSARLQPGEIFIYYHHSHIWLPHTE